MFRCRRDPVTIVPHLKIPLQTDEAPYRWRVSNQLWHLVEPLLEDPPRRFRHPGRLRYSTGACLEGILYVLYTDTPWLQVPYRELGLPSGETCRRRMEEWSSRGLLEEAITILQSNLYGASKIDWSRVIVDASLIEAFSSRMQVEIALRSILQESLELANAIFEYIEVFHNRRRRHSGLGMLTPIEYELLNNTTTSVA